MKTAMGTSPTLLPTIINADMVVAQIFEGGGGGGEGGGQWPLFRQRVDDLADHFVRDRTVEAVPGTPAHWWRQRQPVVEGGHRVSQEQEEEDDH